MVTKVFQNKEKKNQKLHRNYGFRLTYGGGGGGVRVEEWGRG